MAASDFYSFRDQFQGHRIYSATAASNVGHNWLVVDTSAAGTPTYAPVDAATDDSNGAIAIDMDTQAEAQNVCLAQANLLQFDIDKITEFYCRVKMNQAALDATTMVAFGLCGDRNDTIDSLAAHASFRVIGADDTTAVVVETDDGTTDNDDVATGTTLINAYKEFRINFATGTNDVRFLVDGQPVATGTTFDMSAITTNLQPYFQIQKTSDANADGITIAEVGIVGRN